MPHRTQKGWLKQEKRKEGNTWMLFFRAVRKADGKRVENKIRIGLVKGFPSKDCARATYHHLVRIDESQSPLLRRASCREAARSTADRNLDRHGTKINGFNENRVLSRYSLMDRARAATRADL